MNTKDIRFGDIVANVHSGILVHGCNAQGVMGQGIALSVRKRYPNAFNDYLNEHATNGLKLGSIIYTECSPELTIANAITQQYYGTYKRQYVSYQAIHEVFSALAKLSQMSVKTVHYPMIGAGLGGGEWSIISEVIDVAFSHYPNASRVLWIKE